MAPTESKSLKPGDLIEISKTIYDHWAVYVGDGFVVHLAASNIPGACADSLRSVPNKKALVKKEKLTDVVGNDKWKINNSMDEKNKPRPAKNIVRDACARVGETLYYNVIEHNCEHFAKELRYGKAKSKQVLAGGLVMVIGGLALMGSGVSFLPAIAIGLPLYLYGLHQGRKNK